ncbi:MAG: hypothetical protein JWR77_2265 [Rhizorhabdus sp.]|nr:hypothetical protein [Rhizorhabdus sp.]
MKKVLGLFAAPASGNLEAAQAYWNTDFRKALLAMPEVTGHLLKLTHMQVRPLSQRPDVAPNLDWTGVSAMYFDTDESASAFIAAVSAHGVPGDHSVHLPKIMFFQTRELPMWDFGGPQNGPKVFHFFKAPVSLTKEESLKYWNEQNVKVCQGMGTAAFVARYMQNHFVASSEPVEPEYDFIGSPELWFNSVDDSQGGYRDSGKNSVRADDEDKFADRKSTVSLVGEERIMPID